MPAVTAKRLHKNTNTLYTFSAGVARPEERRAWFSQVFHALRSSGRATLWNKLSLRGPKAAWHAPFLRRQREVWLNRIRSGPDGRWSGTCRAAISAV